MRWVWLGLLGLTGCATIDATTATGYATPELCRIAVLGTTSTLLSVDQRGRLEAEQEALRRGVDCMQHASTIRADDTAKRSAAMASGAQLMGQSTYTAPPSAPVATRTSCQNLSNGTTACTTYYQGAPPVTKTCRTIPNGVTYCN